ncbi:MAG: Flp pilus assembly protein CpaB [Desulfuromonadales bacterium]|nr:Flp pilus assembly protein CpaB [Desulfuromonadales bacterium]
MKRYGAVLALGLAVLLGVAAVFLTNKWLSSQTSVGEAMVIKEQTPVAEIVVAAIDIPVGSRLNETNLTLAAWPAANVPRGAFTDMTALADRIAISKLVAGEPLLAAELAAPGSGAGLVAMIEPGMRAMSIKVDEVTGVGGFILPSTFVDIIGVEKSKGDKRKVETILKRIKVLAIAQETFTEEGKAKIVRTVTLEIKPKQAETLALQTHKGSIHLVLRNPLEEIPEKPQVVAKKKSVRTLQARVYKPKPVPFDVEVIRAGNREKVHFASAASE